LPAFTAHGTPTPRAGETRLPGQTYGSLSNLIPALTAVVWNSAQSQYVLKTFQRSDPDIRPFLAHLGRAFITEVTQREGSRGVCREVSLAQRHEAVVAQEVLDRDEVLSQGIHVPQPELLSVNIELVEWSEPPIPRDEAPGGLAEIGVVVNTAGPSKRVGHEVLKLSEDAAAHATPSATSGRRSAPPSTPSRASRAI
jgi:hypothetical protein